MTYFHNHFFSRLPSNTRKAPSFNDFEATRPERINICVRINISSLLIQTFANPTPFIKSNQLVRVGFNSKALSLKLLYFQKLLNMVVQSQQIEQITLNNSVNHDQFITQKLLGLNLRKPSSAHIFPARWRVEKCFYYTHLSQ